MISVVIPLYNKGPHIAQTLESVLAQTLRPTEIIVVDDGSTDDGPNVVAAFSSRGVRLVQQVNQGVGAARNTGLKMAMCEFVAFLDADDWWLSNHQEVLACLIHRFPQAALWSTALQIYREGCFYRPRSPFTDGWVGIVDDFFTQYAHGLLLVNSSSACVRQGALLSLGGFPIGVQRGEDIISWLKLAIAGPVAHAAIVTGVYNQEAVNRTDKLRELGPPGSLLFLAELISNKERFPHYQPGLVLLFDRIAFFTASGFALNVDREGVAAIRRLAWKSRRPRIALAIGLLAIVPVCALRILRNWRHQRVSLHIKPEFINE